MRGRWFRQATKPEGPIISMQILGTVGFFGYQKRAINRNALEPADLNEDGP